MNRTIDCLAAIAFSAVCSAAYADYSVENKGSWPESWPKELEPLRGQARTLEGPLQPLLHYAIPFTKREEFEAAWPHLLKVKGKGTAIRLVRGPNFFLGGDGPAGVVVHGPTDGPRRPDPRRTTLHEPLVPVSTAARGRPASPATAAETVR